MYFYQSYFFILTLQNNIKSLLGNGQFRYQSLLLASKLLDDVNNLIGMSVNKTLELIRRNRMISVYFLAAFFSI